jgi:4'-phosphopantetheinyl transferase
MSDGALPLGLAQVHVYEASLDQAPASIDDLRRLLAPEERERADRFRFDLHRSRFIAGRGILRLLLAPHAGCAPSALRFAHGEHGKPRLAGGEPAFNLSHSGPVALFALAATGELGIDVELPDRELADVRLAERFFSASEVAALMSLPRELRRTAFLHCWTRKEAFIKARGDGLSLALDSFDVTLMPGQPAALTRTAWSDAEHKQWGIMDLSDPKGRFIAAVARQAQDWQLVRHRVAQIVGNELRSNQEEQ